MDDSILSSREVSPTHTVELHAMLYNVRLVHGPTGAPYYDTGFCYAKQHLAAALEAAQQWDGAGDPPGPWIKQVGTARYGPGMALL